MTLRIDSLCAGERETLGAIVTGLGDSNRAKMEAQGLDLAQLQRHEMRLVARDGEALPGGLLGYVKYTWLHVDTLWVAPEQQGGGIGAALLGEAERQAMALGAKTLLVGEPDLEAPDYYLRHGYRLFGELPDYPPGHSMKFFKKTLCD